MDPDYVQGMSGHRQKTNGWQQRQSRNEQDEKALFA